MPARVIQGYFIGGISPGAVRSVAPAQARAGGGGPPPPAFARGAAAIQPRPAPGRPPAPHAPARIAQPHGGGDSFEIDPVKIGLARNGGGAPLPGAVLAKMEAAFDADFSSVRVHVGPQASRIGAIAFTMGNDLYFAPGRYQPDTIQGQQLIGHELAHVIQQRQGRVRAPGTGISVVQDRALETEADRLGTRAAMHSAPVQRKSIQRAASAPQRPGPAQMRPRFDPAQRRALIQRCIEMTNAGNLDYDGDLLGMDLDDADVKALLKDLKNNHGYNANMIKVVESLIEQEPSYLFDDPTHLKNYSQIPGLYPPVLMQDEEGAEYVDHQAGLFGSAFKGPTISFSGSRVYAVAHSEGARSLWAMLNSATGHVGAQNQQVVKTWNPHVPYSFPTNSLKNMKTASLNRPKVMSANAHAEVNEIVQHAIRSLVELHHTPHDVGLMFGSDIQHCAECYWAAQAMWKKGNKKPFNSTGCGNKLFARWREPWDGFYLEYGDNPFRNSNGTFKAGYSVGLFTAHALNKATSGSVGNIYV